VPPGGTSAAMPLRSALAWQITIFIGLQSLPFFGVIAWLPELLRDDGMSASTAGLMVGLMQLTSLASTIGIPVLATRQRSQRGLVVGSVALMLAAFGGLLAFGATGAPLWAGLLGVGGGALLSLALTFLVVRTTGVEATGMLSGMVQSGGYLLAAAGPTGIGALRDLSGGWSVPLIAFLAVTVATLVAGLLAARDRIVGS